MPCNSFVKSFFEVKKRKLTCNLQLTFWLLVFFDPIPSQGDPWTILDAQVWNLPSSLLAPWLQQPWRRMTWSWLSPGYRNLDLRWSQSIPKIVTFYFSFPVLLFCLSLIPYHAATLLALCIVTISLADKHISNRNSLAFKGNAETLASHQVGAESVVRT